jgi:hypothetical protein
MGQNVTIFMAELNIKYDRMKCNHKAKYHTVGLAKNAGDGMFTCDISHPQNVQNEMFRGGRTIRPL